MSSDRRKIIVETLLVLAALAVGAGLTTLLVSLRTSPPQNDPEEAATLVETVAVQRQEVPITVQGFATVRARVRGELVPQVGGEVVFVADELTAGGFFEAEQALVRIDPTDYELAVQRAQADLQEAQAQVQRLEAGIDEADARIANAEANLTRVQRLAKTDATSQQTIDDATMGLRVAKAQKQAQQAQLAGTKAAVARAEARLREAEKNLERTELSMPYDGRVVHENVSVGQTVSPGQSLADVYGTDTMQAMVPLDDQEVAFLDVPGLRSRGPDVDSLADASPSPAEMAQATPPRRTGEPGSPARLTTRFAGERCQWSGRIARFEGEIDARTRLVGVVVEIPRPMQPEAGDAMLTPGMFTRVEFQGRTLRDVCPLPPGALRLNEQVWFNVDGRLKVRDVQVLRREADTVYVRGLEDGDEVIITPLDVVTDGMALRARPAEPEPTTQ